MEAQFGELEIAETAEVAAEEPAEAAGETADAIEVSASEDAVAENRETTPDSGMAEEPAADAETDNPAAEPERSNS